MSKLLLGSIDLTKIKKEDIITTDKNGNTFESGAKYLNVAIWVNDEPDQYGNHAAIKAGKKEDSYYIGNAKEWQKEQTQQAPSQAQSTAPTQPDGDLPF